MLNISFRGLNRKKNEMVCGSLVLGKEEAYIIDAYLQAGIPTNLVQVDYDTVGQYTGICDKNGVEICHGDILRNGLTNCLVSFSDGAFGVNTRFYGWRLLSDFAEHWEVVGNIHQDAGLLH